MACSCPQAPVRARARPEPTARCGSSNGCTSLRPGFPEYDAACYLSQLTGPQGGTVTLEGPPTAFIYEALVEEGHTPVEFSGTLVEEGHTPVEFSGTLVEEGLTLV